MTIAQLHLTGFTADDIETLGRFVDVPEEQLARMVEAAKVVESLPRRAGLRIAPDDDIDQVLFRSEKDHPQRSKCPGCGQDLQRTALIHLAYVFTSCDCTVADYTDLYEQLWHGSCIRPADLADVEEEALAQATHVDRPPLRGQWQPWDVMSVARQQHWLEWAERILTRVRSTDEVAPTTVGGTTE